MLKELIYTLLIDRQPAPETLLEQLLSVSVEQRADEAGMFRLVAGLTHTESGGYAPLDDDLFAPLTPVTLKVALGPAPPLTLINGYVTALKVQYGQSTTLEVVGMDAAGALMNLEEKVRTWPNMADSDVASMILGEYGLTPLVTATQPSRMAEETTVVQRSTDLRFLRYLAERNGYQFAVEADPAAGTPIGFFGPPRADGQPQATLSVNFAGDSNVSEFQVHYDMLLPAAAEAEGLAVADGSRQTGTADAPVTAPMGAKSTLDALPEKSLVRPVQTGLHAADELETYAKAVAERSSWAVTAEGAADPGAVGAVLQAGLPVLVRGAGSAFSGAWLVDRVLHEWRSGEYTMRFTLRRNATGLAGSEVFR